MLEVGFGTGHCLVALAQAVGPTGKVYGIDLSDAMRQHAVENLQKAGLASEEEYDRRWAAPALSSRVARRGFHELHPGVVRHPGIPLVLAECQRVLRADGRIVVVGMSKDQGHGIIFHLYEWTHKHFPNFVDFRPIFIARALEEAKFRVVKQEHRTIWVPVEVVLAVKEAAGN